MRVFTKFMILLISIRILSILYVVIVLEVKAGFYGHFQIPFMLPFYAILLLLCFTYIVREDLQHIKILGLHIFTIFYMFIDVLIYALSINQTWDYWIF